jgi:alpha-L-fucosidase
MKRLISTIIFAVMMAFICGSNHAQSMYQPTWESLSNYQCPDWFRDAKFGIFIHWGVYSVPGFGSEWYPRQMYDQKDTGVFNHHVRTYGTQDKFGYKDFIPMFKAEKFDADQWVDIFKKSGAKYIVPVAEHHDGFAMYNSSLTIWNAFNMGPKRDIIGELAVAVRKQGLIFGLSSHRIEHWFFFSGGMKFKSDVQDAKYFDFYGPAKNQQDTVMSVEFMNDWLLRNVELVDKYRPQLFWFDWYIEQSCLEPYRKTFAAYYYNQGLKLNKGVVINFKNKSFPDNVAVYDIERGSSKASRKFPWQTDTSIGKKSWGWIRGEENKTSNEIIDALIDIVSKNGNLLLNIGPKPDGTISQEQVNVLLGIGDWLMINGEGIYGTRPWIVAEEGPTMTPAGSFTDNKPVQYTVKDIRFTSKGSTVYAFCLDVTTDKKIIIKSMALKADSSKKIKSIELLGSKEAIKWVQKEEMLVINAPKALPCKEAVTYKLNF